MPRDPRHQFPGACYYIRLRGSRGVTLFETAEDHQRFQLVLSDCVTTHGIRLYAWCCLSNQVLLLCKTPEADLSLFMQRLQTRYALWYNANRNSHGHVFSGRFASKLLEEDRFLLPVFRHIHLSVVRSANWRAEPLAEQQLALRAYPYSSFRAYAGTARPHDFMAAPDLFSYLDSNTDPWVQLIRYVEAGLEQDLSGFDEVLESKRSVLGTPNVPDGTDANSVAPEPAAIVQAVLQALDITEDDLNNYHGGRAHRMVVAWALSDIGKMKQKDIAPWVGSRTPGSVSMLIKAGKKAYGNQLPKREEILRLLDATEKA